MGSECQIHSPGDVDGEWLRWRSGTRHQAGAIKGAKPALRSLHRIAARSRDYCRCQDFSILKVNGTKVKDTGKRFKVPGHPASARMSPN
jgi:hypothetical protein